MHTYFKDMRTEMEIYLRDFYTTLDTRESASTLIEKFKSEYNCQLTSGIVLNFEGIDFMSRSFADQFHKEITNNDFDIDLTFYNINDTIRETLRIVEKTQKSRVKSNTKKIVYFKFDSISKIENYLYSI